MKRMILSISVAAILLAGCDGFNNDIDDLPRDLRISVRQITDVDGGWTGTEEGSLTVSAGNGLYSGTIGDIEVTTGLKDNFVRKDIVQVTASVGSLVLSHILLPSRTEEEIDDESTEGNIRYATTVETGDISLRTNSDPAEIIGAFAKDGNTVMGIATPLDITDTEILGESQVNFTINLTSSGSVVIKEAKFRLFDASGEAQTDWEYFIDKNERTITTTPGTDYTYPAYGLDDRSDVDNWTIILLYKDSTDEVYVVK